TGLLLGLAAKRRSRAVGGGAAVAALPLVWRGVAGRWPLPRALRATSVVVATKLVIWRSPREVYEAWRAFDRLPGVLRHLEAVEVLDERRSRWVARAPGGASVGWEVEITDDKPGDVLAWRSVGGPPAQQARRPVLA